MKTSALTEDGFGCEIVDFGCAQATAADVAAVRELLFDRQVLVIRDQELGSESYLAFMKSLGRPVPHVLQNLTVPGFPAILKICDYVSPEGEPHGVLDGGTYWHSDMSYLAPLGIATSLYAVRSAARAGGTGFLDLRRGWELLAGDPDLLAELGCRSPDDALRVEVEHRFGNRHALSDAAAPNQTLDARQRSSLTDVRHRLVEEHPVTGVPSLFAVAGSAIGLAGRTSADAVSALNALEDMLIAALPVYTHRYQPGDLVIWDNMSTLHRGADVTATDDWRNCRLLHRINVDYTT